MTVQSSWTGYDFGPGPEVTASEVVVSAVSDETGRSPFEMTPLGETIDTDALDALFRSASGNETDLLVTFQYADCLVTITSDEVQVEVLTDGARCRNSRNAGV